jgi:hypothetical protein
MLSDLWGWTAAPRCGRSGRCAAWRTRTACRSSPAPSAGAGGIGRIAGHEPGAPDGIGLDGGPSGMKKRTSSYPFPGPILPGILRVFAKAL